MLFRSKERQHTAEYHRPARLPAPSSAVLDAARLSCFTLSLSTGNTSSSSSAFFSQTITLAVSMMSRASWMSLRPAGESWSTLLNIDRRLSHRTVCCCPACDLGGTPRSRRRKGSGLGRVSAASMNEGGGIPCVDIGVFVCFS